MISNKDERTWGMLCHLSGLAGFMVPFGSVIGPLVVWLMKKDEFAFVNDQGREAVNFHLSMLIYEIIAFFMVFIFIGFLVLPLLLIFELIQVVLATVSANDGKPYRYPMTMQFVK